MKHKSLELKINIFLILILLAIIMFNPGINSISRAFDLNPEHIFKAIEVPELFFRNMEVYAFSDDTLIINVHIEYRGTHNILIKNFSGTIYNPINNTYLARYHLIIPIQLEDGENKISVVIESDPKKLATLQGEMLKYDEIRLAGSLILQVNDGELTVKIDVIFPIEIWVHKSLE